MTLSPWLCKWRSISYLLPVLPKVLFVYPQFLKEISCDLPTSALCHSSPLSLGLRRTHGMPDGNNLGDVPQLLLKTTPFPRSQGHYHQGQLVFASVSLRKRPSSLAPCPSYAQIPGRPPHWFSEKPGHGGAPEWRKNGH